ncbi:MAG: hypothetical protein KDJ64_10535 [Nitratireductor sp.]|nr:hypothetical protein [Nitratireductor sp.]
MRVLLFLWFTPLALFWGWFALSVNDWSFGFIMLSRELHDVVFGIYARTLGVEREALPGMIAGACALDTALIMAIAAFRWRASWLPHAREMLVSYWQDETAGDHDRDYADGFDGDFTTAATVPVRPAE